MHSIESLQQILAPLFPGLLGLRIPEPLDREYGFSAQIPPERRPIILVGPYEHHSNELPWLESIADVVEIALTAEGGIDLADLERQLIALRNRPLRIGTFSAASNVTGVLTDVLNLSRGMAYKNALAGLDHGGGKAVIWGDPGTDKSEALLRAYGRFVQSLGGRYVTACDVGTYVQDMDVVARECGYVTGRSTADGGAGDSSQITRAISCGARLTSR